MCRYSRVKFLCIFVGIVIGFFITSVEDLSAHSWRALPQAGISFRGSYWDLVDDVGGIRVHTHRGFKEISLGGLGGEVSFFSRIHEQMFVGFNIGAIGEVENRILRLDGEDVDVTAVVPVLFGFRFNLLPAALKSHLQPYATVGAGAYWLSDIQVRDRYYYREKVHVNSTILPGAYTGLGLNFLLTRSLALNYDMKYHWVDFERDKYNSGIEFSVGLSMMWGKYGRSHKKPWRR